MPSQFRRIGIIGKFGDPSIGCALNDLYRFLIAQGHDVIVEEQSSALLINTTLTSSPIHELPAICDLVIAMGGDGTFLTAARATAEFGTPLLGVNLGRLGFLVDISPDELSNRLLPILHGRYKTEQRNLLQASLQRNGEIIHRQTAVNEVVVHRWVTPSMIEIVTSIDGVFLNSQRSDGLIVATPTGSTAYSLSAGGPILHPGLQALVLVPLNPHMLSNRPIVIDDSVEIEIRFSQAKQINALVTCDHLEIPDVRISDKILIRKAEKNITILHPEDHDVFHILRSKLNWSGGPSA